MACSFLRHNDIQLHPENLFKAQILFQVCAMERWWALSDDKLKEVLEYPVKSSLKDGSGLLEREYGSQIIGYDRHPKDEFRVYMAFRAVYSDGRKDDKKEGFDKFLFATAKLVVYVWDSSTSSFDMGSRLSDMTREQVDGLSDNDYDLFVKYNFKEIKKLASSEDEGKRDWLKHFLKECSDSREKAALLQLLR